MKWSDGVEHKFATVCLGECELEMNSGEVYSGKYTSQNCIKWSNGSVWVRADDSSAQECQGNKSRQATSTESNAVRSQPKLAPVPAASPKPADSPSALDGRWKKENSMSRYRIEGTKVFWLDSGEIYSMEHLGQGAYCLVIEKNKFSARLDGSSKLVFSNGSTWLRDLGTDSVDSSAKQSTAGSSDSPKKADPPSKPTVVHGKDGEKIGKKIDELLGQIGKADSSKSSEPQTASAPAAPATAAPPKAAPPAAGPPAAATASVAATAPTAVTAVPMVWQTGIRPAVAAAATYHQQVALQQQAIAIQFQQAVALQQAHAAQAAAVYRSVAVQPPPATVAPKPPASAGPPMPSASSSTAPAKKPSDTKATDVKKSASEKSAPVKEDALKNLSASSKSAEALKKAHDRDEKKGNASVPFAQGDGVIVLKAFEGDSSGRALHLGLEGFVSYIDREGDARIEFQGPGGPWFQWVLKRNFHYLQKTDKKPPKIKEVAKEVKSKEETKSPKTKETKDAKAKEESKAKDTKAKATKTSKLSTKKSSSKSSRSRSRRAKKIKGKSRSVKRLKRASRSRSRDRRKCTGKRSPKDHRRRSKSLKKGRGRSQSQAKKRKRKSSSSSPAPPKDTTKVRTPFVPRQLRDVLSAPGSAPISKSAGAPPRAPGATECGRSQASASAAAVLLERLDSSVGEDLVSALDSDDDGSVKGRWVVDVSDVEDGDDEWLDEELDGNRNPQGTSERRGAVPSNSGRYAGDARDGEEEDDDDDDMEGPLPEVSELRARALAISLPLPSSSSGGPPKTAENDHRINACGAVEEALQRQVMKVEEQRRVRITSTRGLGVNLMAVCSFCAKFGEVVAMHLEGSGSEASAVIEFRDSSEARACLLQRDSSHASESLRVALCTD